MFGNENCWLWLLICYKGIELLNSVIFQHIYSTYSVKRTTFHSPHMRRPRMHLHLEGNTGTPCISFLRRIVSDHSRIQEKHLPQALQPVSSRVTVEKAVPYKSDRSQRRRLASTTATCFWGKWTVSSKTSQRWWHVQASSRISAASPLRWQHNTAFSRRTKKNVRE